MILLGLFLAVLLMIILIIVWIRMVKKSYKNKNNTTQKAIESKHKDVVITKKQPNSTDIKLMYGQLYQLLESLQLIADSKNLDIVIGRYDFVKKLTANLSSFAATAVYNKTLFSVIDDFKTNYYDKTITDEQLFFCKNPQAKEQLEIFYSVNLLKCLGNASRTHLESIEGLKQVRAIYNRYQKIIDLINMAIVEIKKLEFIEDKETQLLDLDGFKKEIIKKTR